MHDSIKIISDCTLSLVALINPISKIFIVSTLSERSDTGELKKTILKSSLIALIILLSFLFVGNFLLADIFHVQIYSFKIAGGIVLIYRGFEALNKGIFFEINNTQRLEELSIVPLASPMIAGPATITAAVSFPAKYGLYLTAASMVLAVSFNLVVMLASKTMAGFFVRHNIMGALIRITGLIVATIGIQMMLDGSVDFLTQSSIIKM